MENPNLSELSHKALLLPEKPGVYIMKDASGHIIYIGKAKILKNRVSQYFRAGAKHEPKVTKMVETARSFDYIVCATEFEALMLECSLIKQYKPKYNILLKDDRGFHYLRVTPPPYSRISAARQILDDGAKYIGPYNSSYAVTEAVEAASRIFLLPRCSKVFPRDAGRSRRPCLNYSIGLCSGPCSRKISQADYDRSVEEALEFIRGGSAAALERLNEEMIQAAEKMQFERAAKIRDRIRSIEKMSAKQRVVDTNVEQQDVIALACAPDAACFEIFRFTGGRLHDREHFIVDPVQNKEEARAEFLSRYYAMRDDIPPRIELDGPTEDAELLAQWLSHRAGRKVTLHVPQRGEQRAVVDMCRDNAAERLAQRVLKKGRQSAVLDELALLLGMKKVPERIEAYDISHTAGSDMVGGMVVFRDGKPYRSAYRRFQIRGEQGQDDTASMKEVLLRRLREYEQKKDTGEGFGLLPDLILLDGGLGQLHAAEEAMNETGIHLPAFGMVKDGHHKTRALVSLEGEIQIKATRAVFTLISTIQEEVHRFAIDYHRLKQKKSMASTTLTGIPGIGKTRAAALIKAFGGVNQIAQASLEQLQETKGMTANTAEAVWKHYHPQNFSENEEEKGWNQENSAPDGQN